MIQHFNRWQNCIHALVRFFKRDMIVKFEQTHSTVLFIYFYIYFFFRELFRQELRK